MAADGRLVSFLPLNQKQMSTMALTLESLMDIFLAENRQLTRCDQILKNLASADYKKPKLKVVLLLHQIVLLSYPI